MKNVLILAQIPLDFIRNNFCNNALNEFFLWLVFFAHLFAVYKQKQNKIRNVGKLFFFCGLLFDELRIYFPKLSSLLASE